MRHQSQRLANKKETIQNVRSIYPSSLRVRLSVIRDKPNLLGLAGVDDLIVLGWGWPTAVEGVQTA